MYKKKVYVAGAWRYHAEIKSINERINMYPNLKVISEWISRDNSDNSTESLGNNAKNDIDEILSCDYFVAIMTDPKYSYRETFTKLGCALASEKRVIIVCDYSWKRNSATSYEYSHDCMTNVFWHHPRVFHARTLEEMIIYLDPYNPQ